jgi:hypothetical protein
VLNNAGTLSVSSSSAFIQSGAGNAINNIGTLLNFSGGTTSILVPFNNSGYIFSTGSLVLSAGGTQSGSFNVAGLLQLGGGHTITSSGSVASNSEIDVVSGPNLFSGLMRSPSIRFTGGVSNLNGIAPGGLQNYPVMVVVDTGAAVNITGGSFTCGEAIGVLGSGTLSQSGGSTYVPANLFLGIGQGSVGIGRYTLSDGTLNASNVHVENGTLEQSGGTFSGGGSSGVFVRMQPTNNWIYRQWNVRSKRRAELQRFFGDWYKRRTRLLLNQRWHACHRQCHLLRFDKYR